MLETLTRISIIEQVIVVAKHDSRIVGLGDYGSSAEGRAGQWSDVDVAVVVRDADFDEFERDWVSFASQLRQLLPAYASSVGHAWTVYDATPIPLRVDFALHRESNLDIVLTFPNAPTSAQSSCD